MCVFFFLFVAAFVGEAGKREQERKKRMKHNSLSSSSSSTQLGDFVEKVTKRDREEEQEHTRTNQTKKEKKKKKKSSFFLFVFLNCFFFSLFLFFLCLQARLLRGGDEADGGRQAVAEARADGPRLARLLLWQDRRASLQGPRRESPSLLSSSYSSFSSSFFFFLVFFFFFFLFCFVYAFGETKVFNMKRALKIEEHVGTKGFEFGFCVALPARTFVFAVEEAGLRSQWVEALRRAQSHEKPQEEEQEEELGEKVDVPALELDTSGKESETMWVDEYNDFPEGLQKIFRKSKLSDNDVVKNMHVVLNIVRFLYKKRHFKTHLPNPFEVEVPKVEGQEKLDLQLFEEAEKMYDEITPKTRKKRFKMLKELGKGGFGVVHLAQWQDEKDQVAVKVMPHDTTRAQRANLREIFWLTKLDHKNVVKLKHCFLCMSEMWVVLEFMVKTKKKKKKMGEISNFYTFFRVSS